MVPPCLTFFLSRYLQLEIKMTLEIHFKIILANNASYFFSNVVNLLPKI